MRRVGTLQGITQQPQEVAAEALPTSIHLPMQADTSNSSPEGSDADAAPSHDTAADKALTEPKSAEDTLPAPSVREVAAAQTGAQDGTDGQVELMSHEETAHDDFASNAPAVLEEEAGVQGVHGNSAGQASVMSDGSFVDVSAEEAESITAAVAESDEDFPAEGQSPAVELARLSESSDSVRAASLELSEQTKEVLGLLQDEAEESQEAGQTEHVADTEDAMHDDQVSMSRMCMTAWKVCAGSLRAGSLCAQHHGHFMQDRLRLSPAIAGYLTCQMLLFADVLFVP